MHTYRVDDFRWYVSTLLINVAVLLQLKYLHVIYFNGNYDFFDPVVSDSFISVSRLWVCAHFFLAVTSRMLYSTDSKCER